MKTIIIIISWT